MCARWCLRAGAAALAPGGLAAPREDDATSPGGTPRVARPRTGRGPGARRSVRASSRAGSRGGNRGKTLKFMSGRLVALLAVACGATVANLYYAQPLLDTIAREFDVSSGTAGLLVTATQAGYVAGVLFIGPLGGLWQRRKLVARLLALDAVALAVAAAAPTFGVLAAALAAIGITSCAAQILVPFASSLAKDEERGRVVGRVMSGLLLGILLARTVSGLVAQAGGWRLIYALAAGAMLLLAAVLWRALPLAKPPEQLPYPRLLRSVGALIREEPALRHRMAIGFLSMASFSGFWTAIAFMLSRRYHYGEAVIGLFSLAGLAGAGVASFAGRVADRGHAVGGTRIAAATVLGSWGLLALGESSLAALIAGIVALDLGVQATQILNQSVIYRLRPEARSRLTTAYITCYFAGAVTGSAGASYAWEQGGWAAVSIAGAVAATLGALLSLRRS